tara:strand:- start:221 stop:568 length:348 start_codon:yes stop_codon:yes gene_type:complete
MKYLIIACLLITNANASVLIPSNCQASIKITLVNNKNQIEVIDKGNCQGIENGKFYQSLANYNFDDTTLSKVIYSSASAGNTMEQDGIVYSWINWSFEKADHKINNIQTQYKPIN